MKTTVDAISEKQAKEIIKYNIVFHKVVDSTGFDSAQPPTKSKPGDLFDFLKGFKK